MIYLILIALVVFGIVEFLIIKKGMKAGRKSSQYLQGSHAPSSRNLTNRPVPQTPPLQEPLPKEEGAVDQIKETGKVVRFSEQSSKAATSVNVGEEPQQKTRNQEFEDEESSVLDMIQEIRGSGLASKRREEHVSPDNPIQPEESFSEEQAATSETLDGKHRQWQRSQERSKISEEHPSISEDTLHLNHAKQEDGEQALSQEEPLPEEQFKEGLELVRQGKLDEGIKIIENAVQDVPGKADAHFNLGIAYTLKDNIPQAINAYKKAIDIDPQYGKAFYNLGTLYLKQGDIQEAIPRLEQAVKLLSDPMKALWNLYEAYRSSGLFTKALANLKRLIDLEPDDASLYNHLGICYVKLGDYAKAIDAWKRSISLGASSQLIHYNLGKTYELYGEFANAEKHYTQFIELASKKPQWKDLLNEVEERLQNLQVS